MAASRVIYLLYMFVCKRKTQEQSLSKACDIPPSQTTGGHGGGA